MICRKKKKKKKDLLVDFKIRPLSEERMTTTVREEA